VAPAEAKIEVAKVEAEKEKAKTEAAKEKAQLEHRLEEDKLKNELKIAKIQAKKQPGKISRHELMRQEAKMNPKRHRVKEVKVSKPKIVRTPTIINTAEPSYPKTTPQEL